MAAPGFEGIEEALREKDFQRFQREFERWVDFHTPCDDQTAVRCGEILASLPLIHFL